MIKVDVQQIKQRFGIIGNNAGLNRAIDVALQVAPTVVSVKKLFLRLYIRTARVNMGNT